MADRANYVNGGFFLGWLALTLIGLLWNKYSQQNRNYLLIGGILSLFVPVANGVVTGEWFWETLSSSYHAVAYVDMFWLFAGLTALVLALRVLTVKAASDKPEEGEERPPESSTLQADSQKAYSGSPSTSSTF